VGAATGHEQEGECCGSELVGAFRQGFDLIRKVEVVTVRIGIGDFEGLGALPAPGGWA
jgi:hypothetical protein